MHEEVLAYFITWTCYGTFLPGDSRGWTKWHMGEQIPQPLLETWCRGRMAEAAVCLDDAQRAIVEQAIRDHCAIRQWILLAVNCRTNHCHVVVAAPNYAGEQVRDQLKGWAKRRLKAHQQQGGTDSGNLREHWWTRKGSVRHLYEDESVEAAVSYTLEAQDAGGSKANR